MIGLWLGIVGCITTSSDKKIDKDNDGVAQQEDCDDANPDIGQLFWYADSDKDGYGNYSIVVKQCEQPTGYVDNFADCNDEDETIHAAATEVCDGIDNNCDGLIDDLDGDLDVTSTTVYYLDLDRDGYGDPNSFDLFCEPPTEYVANNTDCDDTNASINMTAIEVCDTIDNDCDGNIDDEDDSLDTSTGSIFYKDNDSDGYGNNNVSQMFCVQPTGFVVDNTDCNDNNPMSYPQAVEYCDNEDNNCNGITDENPINGYLFYIDYDSDGFGKPGTEVLACDAPTNYTANALDCDDFDSNVNPNATEICNAIDDDCNPFTSEQGIVTQLSNPPVNIAVSQDPSAPSSHVITTSDNWNFCDGTYYPLFTVEQSTTFTGIGNQVALSGTDAIIINVSEDLVDFALDNIAFQDFTAGGTWSPAILCDASSSSIDIQNTSFENNTNLVSGMIGINTCDFNIDNVTFQNNQGLLLYGISLYQSTATVSNVTFDQNESNFIGALAVNNSSITLEDVEITNETAARPVQLTDATANCQSSLFENNTNSSSYGVFHLIDNTTFSSVQCSFGTGTSDNTPFDITTESHEFITGNNIDFTCENGLCGSIVEENHGQGLLYTESVGISRVRGNYFQVNDYPTLDSFGMYFSCGLSYTLCMNASLNFYVHTRSDPNDPWELRWHESTDFIWWNNSFVSSSDIGMALFDGEYVAVSVGWEDDVDLRYYFDSTSNFSTHNIGTMMGSVRANSITDIENPSLISYSSNIYQQQIRTITLE